MQKPLTVSYRGLEKTPRIEKLIEERVQKLGRHCDHITGVDVAVELPHKTAASGVSGIDYRVRVHLTVPPGHEIVAKYKAGNSDAPVPLDLAVQQAFDSAEKQLDKLSAKQRGDVKAHPAQDVTGNVTRLFKEEGYGFLLADDGREIYFRDSAVAEGRFQDLEVGAGVHFTAASGDGGPQATTVRLIDKRGRPTPMEPGKA